MTLKDRPVGVGSPGAFPSACGGGVLSRFMADRARLLRAAGDAYARGCELECQLLAGPACVGTPQPPGCPQCRSCCPAARRGIPSGISAWRGHPFARLKDGAVKLDLTGQEFAGDVWSRWWDPAVAA